MMNRSLIKYLFISFIALPLTFFIQSCDKEVSLKMELGDGKSSHEETSKPIIPGHRTCFWSRGPVSKDPYINIAYPDAGVFYWNATFTLPEGARLYLKGTFPHSRYMSLISYDGRGAPIESLADYLIVPDKNSINPFVDGASRTNKKRAYTLEIVNRSPEIIRKEGIKLELQTDVKGSSSQKQISHRNSLNAAQYGQGQQSIIYRIYVPDKGKSESGGVPLPEVVLILNNGDELRGGKLVMHYILPNQRKSQSTQ